MRKAPTNRARTFFAPLIASLLVALSVVFVGTASPASAFNDCGKDAGWTKIDQDHGSASGAWGSLDFDAASDDNNTIFYTVNAGYTLELCIKASTSDFYSDPIVGAATGSFSTGQKHDISHIGYQVTGTPVEPEEIAVPATPTVTDPCGTGNATWNVPADTAVLDWNLEQDGDLTVTILTEDTVFEGTGETTHNFGQAVETNTDYCYEEPEEIAVPATPTVADPCGTDNATWNVPADTAVLDWNLEQDGDLTVTILTEDTVFEGTGETTHNFGQAVETNTDYCYEEPEEIAVPATPTVADPCGTGNATWNVPDDTAVLDWNLEQDGDLTVTILTEDTVFEGTGETTHNFGQAVETNVEECEVAGEELTIPAQPAVTDPCGSGNAAWVVPADTEKLDWTLTDGVLTVDITVPDTVFDGTEDTTYSFGTAEETNTDECEVKGEQGHQVLDVEVKGEQATVPTAVDAGLVTDDAPLGAGHNPLWLLAIGSGLGLLGFAGTRRRTTTTR